MKEPANPREANRPAGHPPVAAGRIGVLIANLGTPDATDFWSMRRYLKEFLSDKRVIEENTLIWKLSSTASFSRCVRAARAAIMTRSGIARRTNRR